MVRLVGSLWGLALVACQPSFTPEDLPRVAQEFGVAYNDWNEARLVALFAEPPNVEHFRMKFAWLGDRLGACGQPEPLWTTGARGARFRYLCERGALEASFVLDDHGRITDVRHGATGIPVEEPLGTTVRAVVASLPWREADVPRGVKQEAVRAPMAQPIEAL